MAPSRPTAGDPSSATRCVQPGGRSPAAGALAAFGPAGRCDSGHLARPRRNAREVRCARGPLPTAPPALRPAPTMSRWECVSSSHHCPARRTSAALAPAGGRLRG
eukprot:33094-Alexandrium_andersonii.AAC.1